jgi:hypothetical protein
MTSQHPKLVPLPQPHEFEALPADHVITGQPIPAIQRIKLFSAEEWEEFVLEWADSLREEYAQVFRCGGAGDLGRDVVAFVAGSDDWDNFQCKHYDHPLYPSDVWVEIGKLFYHVHSGAFTYPRRYYFVAPQFVGTSLSKLLHDPELLRQRLIDEWEKHCRAEITSTTDIELKGGLRILVETADFSIFRAVPPMPLIQQHARTPWHSARFGGGLPPRPPVPRPPEDVQVGEINYVDQLLRAYAEHTQVEILSVEHLRPLVQLFNHFCRSREDFYSAESLRNFSRDTLPPGEFQRLQEEVFHGVVDVAQAPHPDGYARVLKTTETARALQVTAHALVSRLYTRDRSGICHQLANEDRLRWVP